MSPAATFIDPCGRVFDIGQKIIERARGGSVAKPDQNVVPTRTCDVRKRQARSFTEPALGAVPSNSIPDFFGTGEANACDRITVATVAALQAQPGC